MKIGLVIHGPEIIDSGQAALILDFLSSGGEVNAILGGTMGKTAVIDASLEDSIDIRNKLKPSEAIEFLSKSCDAVYLMNHGKSFENGLTFGSMVTAKFDNLDRVPILQIERPGLNDGRIICWNKGSHLHANELSNELGLGVVSGLPKGRPVLVEDQGRFAIRKVSGVFRGENILVNGIIIGRAESEDVKIILEDGFIRSIDGGSIKEHGVEKLHGYEKKIPVDIRSAWVKSGPLRRINYSPRMGDRRDKGGVPSVKAVLIDHNAEDCFELADGADVAVTVGDDTTAIAADILYRLAVPVIGITDGDLDGLHRNCIYPGSIILRLVSGSDDIVGRSVCENLFSGEVHAVFDSKNSLTEKILNISDDLIINIEKF